MIDSSPMYGRAEAVIGDLLAEMAARPRAFLATEVWTTGGACNGADAALGPAVAHRRHRPDANTQSGGLAHSTNNLAPYESRGSDPLYRITHYTTRALPELARVLVTEPGIDFVQLGYSLATRAPETELLPTAAAHGIAVIINQPFEQGDLFRRVRGRALPGWAQLFLKYILAEPAVTCVISATNNPEHMKDYLGAGFGRLPNPRQRQQIRELWDAG